MVAWVLACMLDKIKVGRSSTCKDYDYGCTCETLCIKNAEVWSDMQIGVFCATVELKAWE